MNHVHMAMLYLKFVGTPAENYERLTDALRSKDYKVAEEIVFSGAIDVNWQDADGDNILHLAAAEGAASIVDCILKLPGVDVNASPGSLSFTPLMFAATNNDDPEVVRILLENGADATLVNADGYTALMIAARQNHVEVVKELLSIGIENLNPSAFIYLMGSESKELKMLDAIECSLFHTEMAVLILSALDIEQLGLHENTVLHRAVLRNNFTAVKFLVEEKHMEFHQPNAKGCSPFTLALERNFLPICEFFFEKDSDLYPDTAMALACSNILAPILGKFDFDADSLLLLFDALASTGRVDVLEMLESKYSSHENILYFKAATFCGFGFGGYLDLADDLYNQFGAIMAQEHVILCLKESMSTGFCFFREEGVPKEKLDRLNFFLFLFEKLIERSDIMQISSEITETMTTAALDAASADAKFLPFLKRLCSELGIAIPLDQLQTFMFPSAASGNIAMLEYLLGSGVDINAKTKLGSALFGAAIAGHYETVKFLLEKGADPILKRENDDNPLILAINYSKEKVFHLLLEKYDFFFAMWNPSLKYLKALLEKGADARLRKEDGTNCLHFYFSEDFNPEFVVEAAKMINDDFLLMLIEKDNSGQTPVQVMLARKYDNFGTSFLSVLQQLVQHFGHKKMTPVIKEVLNEVLEAQNVEIAAKLFQEFESKLDIEEYVKVWNGSTESQPFYKKLLILAKAFSGRKHKIINPSSALYWIVSFCTDEEVQDLLDCGADPQFKNADSGYSVLTAAAFRGESSVFKMIIDKVNEEEIRSKARNSMTAILAACASMNPEIIGELLGRGADLTAIDSEGRNCFHFLFGVNRWTVSFALFIAELLDDKTIEYIALANKEGNTPIDLMIKCGDTKRIKSLLAAKPLFSDFVIEPQFEPLSLLSFEDNKCLICHEVFEVEAKVAKLPCKHYYHEACFFVTVFVLIVADPHILRKKMIRLMGKTLKI